MTRDNSLDVERLAQALSNEYESRKQWPRNNWDGIAKRVAAEYARLSEGRDNPIDGSETVAP